MKPLYEPWNALERRFLLVEAFAVLASLALIIWFLAWNTNPFWLGVPLYYVLSGAHLLRGTPTIYQQLRGERAAAVGAFMEENARLMDAEIASLAIDPLKHRSTIEKLLIGDMVDGDVGYTTPWAMQKSPKGKLFLHRRYPVQATSDGASTLWVKKDRKGWHVDSSRCHGHNWESVASGSELWATAPVSSYRGEG
jgi:hypothetical protein